MNSNNNYYAVLGLEPGADAECVRATYRRLMQQGGMHPDRGGDAKTAALINRAYTVLSDPEQKREYDLRMEVLAQVAEGFTFTVPRPVLNPDIECLFCARAHNFGGRDMADLSCDACGSALQPVSAESLAPDGQRATQRIYKSLDMHFYTEPGQRRGYAAKTEDVSPQGMRLKTRLELQPGQRLRIVSRILDAVGEVTHCKRDASLWRAETVAGIAFLTLRYARPSGAFVSRRI